MAILSRDILREGLLGLVLALCLVSLALAQTSSPPQINPGSLDVTGVKLGMTPDQAIAALSKFDPSFVIEKDYEGSSSQEYGDNGQPLNQLPTTYSGYSLPAGDAFYVHIYALDETPACTGAVLTCLESQPASYDQVDVWLSPVPGQERVIAVMRTKHYNQSNTALLPPLTSLETAIFNKYPKTFTMQNTSGTYTVDWLFDAKRRLISPSRATELNLNSWNGSLPTSASAGDGIGLSLKIDIDSVNSGLADSFSIALYDANALYQFSGQLTSLYQAAKAKLDAAAIANAAKNAPKTNF